jgi:hypothetical protein
VTLSNLTLTQIFVHANADILCFLLEFFSKDFSRNISVRSLAKQSPKHLNASPKKIRRALEFLRENKLIACTKRHLIFNERYKKRCRRTGRPLKNQEDGHSYFYKLTGRGYRTSKQVKDHLRETFSVGGKTPSEVAETRAKQYISNNTDQAHPLSFEEKKHSVCSSYKKNFEKNSLEEAMYRLGWIPIAQRRILYDRAFHEDQRLKEKYGPHAGIRSFVSWIASVYRVPFSRRAEILQKQADYVSTELEKHEAYKKSGVISHLNTSAPEPEYETIDLYADLFA